MATKKPATPKKTPAKGRGGTPAPAKTRTTLATGTPKTARMLAEAMLREAAPSALKPPARKTAPNTLAKRKPGRPSSHTPKLAAAVCTHLMAGLSLRAIAKIDGMPSMATVIRWLHDDVGGFRAQYARAREAQAEILAEEVIEIADEAERTVTIEWEDRGKTRQVPVVVALDPAEVAHRKLRADARKWYASKVAPKKYGEHLNVDGQAEMLVTFRDLTGRKGDAPEQGGGQG